MEKDFVIVLTKTYVYKFDKKSTKYADDIVQTLETFMNTRRDSCVARYLSILLRWMVLDPTEGVFLHELQDFQHKYGPLLHWYQGKWIKSPKRDFPSVQTHFDFSDIAC